MNDFCYYKSPHTQLFRIFYLNLQQPLPPFYKSCKYTLTTSYLNEYYDMKHLSHLKSHLCHILRTMLSLCVVTLLLLSLMACSRSERRYVIAISQCSEDVWREKLNQELRIAALYYNNVDLRISSAYDDVKLQTEQIDKFVQDDVDLLVVAPGQVSISPAIDRAYEKGIPVIIFDRRTHSDKYTAFIGADNREIGRQMGGFLASYKGGNKRVLEICGLDTSSPAMERQEGFDSVASAHPDFDIATHVYVDWTEQGAYRVVDSLLSTSHPTYNYVFAHNDRMAMGARRAFQKHGVDLRGVQFLGVDAMPQSNGGMQLVHDGTLLASSIYPTRGDEVMRLAMNILQGKPYQRDNQLSSALVTKDNARVLLMQNDETVRQQDRLSALSNRVDKAASDFNTQRIYLLVMLVVLVLLIVSCALIVRAYQTKARYNRQLKKSMDEQRKMTEQVDQMTQTQLRFFTNISHELRTPLTLIAGPTEQLLDDPSIRGKQREMLQMVARNTKVLVRLVGEILDFRKVQNNKEHLTLNRFALQDDLAAWAHDFAAVAKRRQITVTLHTEDVPSGDLIIADRDKLAHVFFNLMNNALKYTPGQGTITITLKHEADHYLLLIADTGKGISADELPHLFERFYQAKGAIGGTGIGLSLVKAYVDMHQGTVYAESELGKGTTFHISLPDSQPGYDPQADKDAPIPTERNLVDDTYIPEPVCVTEQAQRIVQSNKTDSELPLILIIDDNNGMRAYLRSILQDRYQVIEATDGKMGLEKARQEVPKLVICDVMMPVMDGLEFTRRLKEDTATSHIPVILLTARSLSEQREEGYEQGADSYITKPFSSSLLLARIENLLRNRVLLSQLFSHTKEEEQEEQQLGSRDRTFVEQLRKVIQTRMGDSELSVEQIGADLGFSRVQLYRKVKALTGQTPVELLRKARLSKARHLLETTDQSIAEIAYHVGFTSPSYFNKCFKDEFGCNPSEVREHQ